MPVEYDRHRREQRGGLKEKASSGGPLTPRRPLLWLIVQLYRALRWVVRSLAYGVAALAHSWPGRIVLCAAVAGMLLDATFGSDPVSVPLLGALAWPALIAFGAYAYRKRRIWEERVRNAIYHLVPGHNKMEQEVVWFGNPGVSARLNLGRWVGSWAFGFRLPPGVMEADTQELAERLRERLPAARGSSWRIDWEGRESVAQARLVKDMPDSLTRDEMLARIADAGEEVDRDRIPIGVSVDGVEYYDVELTPHLLGTGETNKGKSVAQLGIVCHALQHSGSWSIYACDPKRVELGYLEGKPGVKMVAKDLAAVTEAIQRAEAVMDKRFAKMEAGGANHIRKLNPRAKRILVVVDELQQVTMPSGAKDDASKEVDALKQKARSSLERIAALGRAAGVHLYLTTQRPDISTGTLTGPLKHNLSGRLAVGKMDNSASMMALDTVAATSLPDLPKGRAIWRGTEGEKRVQVAFTKEADLPPAKADKGPGAEPKGSGGNGSSEGGKA